MDSINKANIQTKVRKMEFFSRNATISLLVSISKETLQKCPVKDH